MTFIKSYPSALISRFHQEQSQVELELRFLEALEMYPPSRLQGEFVDPRVCGCKALEFSHFERCLLLFFMRQSLLTLIQ